MALSKFKKKSGMSEKPKVVTAKLATYDYINASRDFEASRIGDIERSRTIAWRVAAGAMAAFIMSAVALMLLTPLKEVRPYVIRVDNNTGATDIVTMLTDSTESEKEATAKYFSALYVQLVEGYDWYTIQQQYKKAMMFSDSNIQQRLTTKFEMPDAPHKVYKDGQRVVIKVNNVSFINEKGLIQVRFTKSIESVNGGVYNRETGELSPKPIVTNHIATIGYDYVNIPTLDEVRLVNPFGFTVKAYRVDEDASITSPKTNPTPTAPVPATTAPTTAITTGTSVTPAKNTTGGNP